MSELPTLYFHLAQPPYRQEYESNLALMKSWIRRAEQFIALAQASARTDAETAEFEEFKKFVADVKTNYP